MGACLERAPAGHRPGAGAGRRLGWAIFDSVVPERLCLRGVDGVAELESRANGPGGRAAAGNIDGGGRAGDVSAGGALQHNSEFKPRAVELDGNRGVCRHPVRDDVHGL